MPHQPPGVVHRLLMRLSLSSQNPSSKISSSTSCAVSPASSMSSPKVTAFSLLLILSSLSIVFYHQLTFRMVDPPSLDENDRTVRSVPKEMRQVGFGMRQAGRDEATDGAGMFSIVLLSYRSPKSLRHTLVSLCHARVHEHPNFSEFVIYFQVFEEEKDVRFVRSIFAGDDHLCGIAFNRYRAIGHPSNFPVASATLRALRNVSSEFILYLECDRPVVQVVNAADLVHQQVTLALQFLQQQRTHVFRMQLYSSSALRNLASPLPMDTYGPSPTQHCANVLRYHAAAGATPEAPEDGILLVDNSVPLTQRLPGASEGPPAARGICNHKALAKRTLGNVFYTAYCKHWSKLKKTAASFASATTIAAPQQDMCDAFCFYQWAAALLKVPSEEGASDQINGIRNVLKRIVQLHELPVMPRSRNSGGGVVANTSVICLSSDWCNWSNQPSMYRRDWYLAHIGGPCENTPEGRGYCIGSPGRQSAVRQELFFVKRREHWARKQHKICLSSGSFIHHEVDNRE